MKKTITIISLCFLISGCANSANHEVVTTTKGSDAYLTCKEIRIEKKRIETIVDGVNQDKEDMTGADVVDGLLWFPFNVIAKQSNYSNAIKAAEKRKEHLIVLEKENKCKT